MVSAIKLLSIPVLSPQKGKYGGAGEADCVAALLEPKQTHDILLAWR